MALWGEQKVIFESLVTFEDNVMSVSRSCCRVVLQKRRNFLFSCVPNVRSSIQQQQQQQQQQQNSDRAYTNIYSLC